MARQAGIVGAAVGVLAVAIAGIAVVAGGGGGDSDDDTLRWVALGDSYTSGEGNPPYDDTAPCTRALEHAYPLYAATELEEAGVDVDLDFRACSGAVAADLAEQAATVDADTDVVTVTIGGNDAGFARLVASCLGTTALPLPLPPPIEPCLLDEGGIDDTMETVRANVTAGLSQVVERLGADGVVLLLGYPNPLPESGRCGLIGGRGTETATAVALGLDAVHAEVALELEQVEYVPVLDAFADHHACGDPPWIRGLEASFDGDLMDALNGSYHPNHEGMTGYAAVLLPELLARID